MAKKAVKKKAVKRKISKPSRQDLARPGDPYVAPDNSMVSPEPISRTQVPTGTQTIDPETFKPIERRTLKDLPASVQQVNGVACIFMYTMMGIGDREIAGALKISLEEVRGIRKHSAYIECFNTVVSTFIDANSDHIHSRIAAYSHGALSQIAQVAFKGSKENVRLRASMDLMDRAGHQRKDGNARSDGIMNELRIIVVEGEGKVNVELNGGDHG
jgi:hypothetical protein